MPFLSDRQREVLVGSPTRPRSCRRYQEAARRLGLDRRTVKSRIDPALLARLR